MSVSKITFATINILGYLALPEKMPKMAIREIK